MNIYIAGPFFSDEQLSVIKDIEEKLDERNIEYFSPRLEGGIIKDMTPEERKAKAKEIYESNINGIYHSDFLLAVIDDFDPGTVFEIGFAAGINDAQEMGPAVITYSPKGYGLNVMLSQCSIYHATDVGEAINIMNEYYTTGKILNPIKAESVT